MTLGGYEKRRAKEICSKIEDGLGFPCKIVLMKWTLFSLHGKKYAVRTDAPEDIIQDIIIET